MQAKLELEWSPEQIAAWLRCEYPDRRDRHLCHETIYQAVYHGGKHGLTRQLTARLRTGRPLRKRRRRAQERATRFVAQGCLIDTRPVVVEARSRIGDWEGDLIVGQASRSAIGTLVDRTSRCLRLIRLPAGHAAENFAAAAAAVLEQLPPHARLTLTWDQGSEMARHDLLARYFTDGIYFAHPASPWLRGTNENTNGLLRQYWPKGSDLSAVTDDQLRTIETRLNDRPRKILDWKTPASVFTASLRSQ